MDISVSGGFLSDKTDETYVNVFNQIKSSLCIKSISFLPNPLQIGFKAATYNAVKR